MELSRRFFLSGAISLIAANTFIPSVSAMSNIAKIYANGKDDDSYGLSCLLRNEPVIFNKENIGVDEHKGITFHGGRYLIDHTVEVPKGMEIKIDNNKLFEFLGGENLTTEFPFFTFEDYEQFQKFSTGKTIYSIDPKKHQGQLIKWNGKLPSGSPIKWLNNEDDEILAYEGNKNAWSSTN